MSTKTLSVPITISFALLLILAMGVASSAQPDPKPPYFNFEMRQMLIEGSYDILPGTPVAVGNTRQLLMDDRVVDDAGGCKRTVHRPEKHESNPLITSKDLVTWTQPVVILRPDELDPTMFYGMPVTKYQGVYLGFLQMFYSCSDPVREVSLPGPKSHQIDIQLAWSRDGIDWERHPERPIFLETGAPGSYDWGMVFVLQGLPEKDEKVYIYYQGDQAFHIGTDVKNNPTGNSRSARISRATQQGLSSNGRAKVTSKR
jgi:hypothetical protein